MLSGWTIEEKVGQMLVVGFHGLEPPDYILEWLSEGRISGVVLFARNVASPQQLAELTQACHTAARTPILIAIDQEGGTVARLLNGFTESPGAMALGAANSPDLAERVSYVLGSELRALGINWNLAPVVDITHNIQNPSVGARSLGSDKIRVSQLASAEIRGFQRAGVAATAKHFPGLGNTPVDTHEALAVVEGPVDYLWENDLVPFRYAVEAGTATVMVSHVKFPALDPTYPSTLSPKIIQGLLREEIGFKGVVCTDCLEMRAITNHYKPGESAIAAALAGEDLLFFSHSFSPSHKGHAVVFDDMVKAVKEGRIPMDRIDDAVERVIQLKEQFAIRETPDAGMIANDNHLAVMKEAARAGTVLLRRESANHLPITTSAKVAVIEFASILESEIMERGGKTGLGTLLCEQFPGIQHIAIKSLNPPAEAVRYAASLAQNSDLLIVATRNAHLIPPQLEMARQFLDMNPKSVLVCLRNPYDVSVLPAALTVICTCGDSKPSLEAAVDALMGLFTPAGTLPVAVELR